ncbi:methyl-accepting chemotaxis protein [Hylemonella gracilis]|uniref:Methyl-accepting chemotaxis sensory transducer n=1 Tax=Hylemonella gracilis ATCC 19624 TaxID=887062 RepID=F3KVG7_9BURK|nr:methyl-accepting chemotaxis protein [Hylemonella gracilis]EGI76205.1 methyl-accepting chemotaxis sensory transducer [Hylemonella gracilis ATCC 19624]
MPSLTYPSLFRAAVRRFAALWPGDGRFTIGMRLALGFGLVLTLFAGTTVYAVLQMGSMERNMASAVHAHAEIAMRAGVMRKSIDDIYLNALLLVLSTQRDDLEYYQGLIEQSRKTYQQARNELLALTRDGHDVRGLAQGMQALAASEIALVELQQSIARRISTAAAAREPGGFEIDMASVDHLAGTVRARFDQWVKAVEPIVEATAAAGRERQDHASNAAYLARAAQVAASLVAILGGAVAAWVIAMGVTRPIRDAVQVAERVARGDLSLKISRGGRDEMGALLDALARMQDSLGALVGEVRDAAHAIQDASAEVASGNHDLSRRTEHAASQLQQTVGTMEQISGAVRQSSEAARSANELASGAAGAAEQGGSVAERAVLSMQDITAQSHRIADIIGVIEGIAFQTNILALNAAVEAARAGEQGRGFAVVAGEVRGLAQRSDVAAKDIRQLIQSSIASVEIGRALVSDAGRNMDGIVAQVREVTKAIDEIRRAAESQSTGVDGVARAMNEIDRATQQNAALVEQSAAAAESLQAQAQRLTRLVSAFQLAGPSQHLLV